MYIIQYFNKFLFDKLILQIPQMEVLTNNIAKTNDKNRRLSTTSQYFHRIDDKFETSRNLRTSKNPRQIRHQIKKISLDNTKQNICHEKYLKSIKSALKINQNQLASNHLLQLRKQYDKMAKTIKQQSSGISLIKKQTEYIKNKIKNYNQNWNSIKQKLQHRQAQYAKIQQKQTQVNMQTKMLQQIIFRMKQEQIKNKNIWSEIQSQMKQKRIQLRNLEDQALQWDQTIHRAHEHMSGIQQKYHKTKQNRRLKFNDFRNYMVQLEDQEKFEQERRERTFQLLSMESNDIMDAKNIVLRDVLMTNKLVDKLLENKINETLTHYQALQNSYHIIKTQTNISDPQALTKKFLSYPQNLEQITHKIKCFQKRQQELLERNKQLKQFEKQRISKRLEQQRTLINGYTSDQEQKEKLIQQCFQKQLILKKIRSWLDKINTSLDIKRRTITNNSEQIVKICNYMSSQLEKLKKQNSPALKFQSPQVRLKKVIKQFSDEQIKQRRSEAQEMKQNNMAENMYIYQQRKVIKKNIYQIKSYVTPKNLKQ